MNRLRYILILAIAIVSVGCSRDAGTYKDTRVIMATYVTITADRSGLPEDKVIAAVNSGFAEITRVDNLMSVYKPESQLSLINAGSGAMPVKADPEVIDCIEKSVRVSELTGGSFDTTVGPLVKLWKIGSDAAHVPDAADIDRAKALVDYRKIVIDRAAGTVFLKQKGMSVDLGGIAKGYSADRAVEALKKAGIRGAVVSVAGDIKAFGTRPDGKPWKVGVQHPRDKSAVIAEVALKDEAVSTSGDYERYFRKAGKRYSHIIDPRTGYPVQKGLISVTVVAKESWSADAMGKLFVLGPEEAYQLALAHPEIEVLMVDKDGKTYATGRFRDMNVGPVKVGE